MIVNDVCESGASFLILSIFPSVPSFSRMGVRIGDGAPFKRDGAPNSVATLNPQVGLFPAHHLTDSAQGDGQTLSCHRILVLTTLQADFSKLHHCRPVVPRFAALHCIAACAIAEVTVPMGWDCVQRGWVRSGKVHWAWPHDPKSFVARCCLFLNAHDLRNNCLLFPSSIQRCPSPPSRCVPAIRQAICDGVRHVT